MENVNWSQIYSPHANLSIQGNPALDDLKQRYAQQQAQKAQENAEFTKEIAKLNFGGAKDADLEHLHNQYGDIVKTFSNLRNINDPKQRAQLGLALQQKQNEFLYNIEKSKDANKQDMDLAHLPLNPNANLAEGATDRILGLTKLSTFDPKREKAYSDVTGNLFDKPVDALGIRKKILDASTTDLTQKLERKNLNGIDVMVSSDGKVINPAKLTDNVIAEMKNNKPFRDNVMKQYGSPEAYIKQVQQETKDDYGYKEKVVGHQFPQRPERPTFIQQKFYDAHGYWPDPAGQTGGAPPTPQDVPITFKGTNANGSPINMTLKNAVPVGIPKATVIPTMAINEQGKEVKLDGGEFRVIEKGEKPVLNDDITITTNGKKTTLKKGSFVQPAFEAAHPESVTTEPVYHVQQDHKGYTHNYYVPVKSVSVNATGQKNQSKAIESGAPQGDHKQVKSQVEVDKLPKGTHFIWTDGKEYVK